MTPKWITPFMKQGFVVAGVALNMASFGTVIGFTAPLLPQLRDPTSGIQVDDVSSSWIASIVGISLLVGNLVVPVIMGRFGRKLASLLSSLIVVVCWLWIALATSVTSLLIARFLQGFSLGINLSLSPIMVGELSSPTNRGVFSSFMTSIITAATVAVHVMGSYMSWQTTAVVCAFIAFTSFAIVLFSPESPSWLADKGRFEDSKKAYRWLRGDEDDDELERMHEAKREREFQISAYRAKGYSIVSYFVNVLQRKDFYKPVIIMIHLYAICLWAGMSFVTVYVVDVIKILVGGSVDEAMHLTILDCQRLVSSIFSVYLIKQYKRRIILFTTVGINIIALIAGAAYSFAKVKGALPFDYPAIGIVLLHLHISSYTLGAVSFPVVISGELFPLQFRSLAGGISAIAFSINYFVTSKTIAFLFSTIGIYGAYALYAAVTFYCLVVVWIMLPETKDRSLQDIEEEFRDMLKLKCEDALTSFNDKNGEVR